MAEKVMDSFIVAIVAVVLIPIVDSLAQAANVTGTTRTILVLLPVFIALGALFIILSSFRRGAKS